MSSSVMSSIVFAFVFGGALLGMFMRKLLPQNHLSDDSKGIVMIAMGLVATMTALVLGLLISSAKSSFDALSSEMTEISSKIILLDQTLADYGPDAKEARDLLRSLLVRVIDQMELKKPANPTEIAVTTREMHSLYYKIQGFSPKGDSQRSFQADALSILKEIRQTRWLIYAQHSTSISMPMLIILVSWLTALFISFGLYAPANGTVVTSLLVAALSVSCAVLLILELYSPYYGLIKISSAPLSAALTQLGN
ncbi:MAG TPA: hypothetical protein VKH63_12515 [Candidatus Acidoferrum sp.]|jgi:hypothetical protein|nr:hypothetical protein [Candidatus Acidoferrum sp.]